MREYLALYNLASAAGWGYVLFLGSRALADGKSPAEAYEEIGQILTIVQTAAVMEILHSAMRLVRSPLMTVAMQVSSRLLLVWGYTRRVEACQQHWSLYLMMLSWALVETPRYLFYAVNLYTDKVPFPLHFLRYNLFIVLYPSGISGEVLQMFTALATDVTQVPVVYTVTRMILWMYTHAGPFMIFFMFKQRGGANKKRSMAGRAKKPITGLQFPVDETGNRGTSKVNKEIFAAATDAADEGAAAAMRAVKNWRFGYAKHVVKHFEIALRDEKTALQTARAGLEAAHNAFVFVQNGEEVPFVDAMRDIEGHPFVTGEIQGSGDAPAAFSVPYKNFQTDKNHGALSGDKLLAQLDKWAEYGTIEPSARDALREVATNEKFTNLNGKVFVLMGAGSAMGPYSTLMAHGATVIAVDIGIPRVWERIITTARNSPGRLIFPMKAAASSNADMIANAGCDLLGQTPQIKNWLIEEVGDQEVVMGNHTYLDGELHVRLSIACDAIMSALMATRKGANKRMGCAFLCSPTDVFLQPEDAVAAAKKNNKNAPLWQKLLAPACGLRKNTRKPVDGGRVAIDGLIVDQGPNYALAKRIQHWRVMVARDTGFMASSNIAPSTATLSVISNALFKIAYRGYHLFKPMEITHGELSRSVMAGLLIHDVMNKKSAAQPTTKLSHPAETFGVGAFHGGVWRLGWLMRSTGRLAFIAGFAESYGLITVTVEAAIAYAVIAVTNFGG